MNELPTPGPGIGRNKDIISLELEFDLPAEAARIFSILGDEAQWPEHLNPRVLKRQPNSKLIVAFPDFTRSEFSIEVTPAGSKVSLVHDLIKSSEARKEYRKVWMAWFKEITKRVSL